MKSILGRHKLTSITPADVQRMMREIVGKQVTYVYHRTTAGKESRRTITLTARATNQAKGILGNALDDAMVLGLIAANPARPVRSLKHEAKVLTVWTAGEIIAFTNTTLGEGADYHALFYLALTAGLRAGELLALEWDDLTGNRLHVARTMNSYGDVTAPKSAASNRILTLADDTVSTLQRHRAGLAEARIESPLMFPTSTGRMGNHSNLLRAPRFWSARAGDAPIRIHDLRYTFASMSIAAGTNVVDLARQLGHEDPGFTLMRYAHFFERATPRAALTLAQLTGSENRKVVILGGNRVEAGPN